MSRVDNRSLLVAAGRFCANAWVDVTLRPPRVAWHEHSAASLVARFAAISAEGFALGSLRVAHRSPAVSDPRKLRPTPDELLNPMGPNGFLNAVFYKGVANRGVLNPGLSLFIFVIVHG